MSREELIRKIKQAWNYDQFWDKPKEIQLESELKELVYWSLAVLLQEIRSKETAGETWSIGDKYWFFSCGRTFPYEICESVVSNLERTKYNCFRTRGAIEAAALGIEKLLLNIACVDK